MSAGLNLHAVSECRGVGQLVVAPCPKPSRPSKDTWQGPSKESYLSLAPWSL